MNKILIAEDEAPIANLIRTVLTDAGYRCVWASDGTQAADLLEKEPFDLALLDIMLPGFNGYELLEHCRELELPAIFLTAKAEVEDRVKGLRLGAEDYLPKPFALPELLARVDEIEQDLYGMDCGACGAPSCWALATDIALGRAAVEDCIYIQRERHTAKP